MKSLYAVQAIDDDTIPRRKVKIKRLKKALDSGNDRHSFIKKQDKTLQKNQGKQYVFNMQLADLIDAIPDAVLLKDRDGRKLITNKFTKNLFKQHDLDWYSKTTLASQEIPAKECARNNFDNLLPLSSGEGWDEGIKCPDYFVHIPNHLQDEIALKSSDLHLALKKCQFKLYYQTQVDGAGRMLGAEVLLR